MDIDAVEHDRILDALVSALAQRMKPPAPEPEPPAPEPPPPPTPRKRRKKEPVVDNPYARAKTPEPPPPRQTTRWERTLADWRKKNGGGRIPERGTAEYDDLTKLYYRTK